MKKLNVYLSAILFLMLSGITMVQAVAEETQDTEAPQPFRVMSFNVRYGNADDGLSSWEYRHELLLKTIQTYDPDILGVQEAILKQVKYLRDEMDGYVFFGAGRDDGKLAGEMCAIYYRSDRFRRIDAGHFWLSEEPDKPGSYGWDAACPRMVSWLRLRDKTDNSVIFVANTHWDHRGDEARLNSAKMIRQRLAELAEDAPVIIMGDFNCNEDSRPYGVLISDESDDTIGLADSYREMVPQRDPQEATFHGFRGDLKGSRIDWVLHSLDLKVLAADIDRTHEDNLYPSDHYPVTATFQQTTEKNAEKQAKNPSE